MKGFFLLLRGLKRSFERGICVGVSNDLPFSKDLSDYSVYKKKTVGEEGMKLKLGKVTFVSFHVACRSLFPRVSLIECETGYLSQALAIT